MKPPPFAYRAPGDVDEVLEILAEAEDGAAVLAGGQSLMPLLNMRFARPDVVIDINRVEGLDTIDVTSDSVSLGSLVRLGVLEWDATVRAALPVLCAAAAEVAHPQIRNRTTVGGTLGHADPSAEMPTVAVALGATVRLRSRRSARAVSAEDFFESVFSTTKEPDELIVGVDFPIRQGMRFVYDEIARRQGDFPFAGLCLGIRLQDGAIAEARAAAAGVADVPLRLAGLESALVGHRPSDVAEDAAAAAAAEVDPPSDIHGSADYRRAVIRTLVRRNLNSIEEM